MNYDFNEKTFGEVFNKALELAKENKNEAQEFFKQYIQFILEDNDKVNTIEEAERIAKSNFGYFAGYYTQEVCDIIYETYQCSHPIFGDKPFSVFRIPFHLLLSGSDDKRQVLHRKV